MIFHMFSNTSQTLSLLMPDEISRIGKIGNVYIYSKNISSEEITETLF